MSGHVQEDYPLVGGYGENRSKWFYVGAIVFVCWNILLFSLAVAAIAKVNNIKDPEQPEPYVFSQTVSAAVNSTIPALNVVSLLPNGSVRSGAGTTIYSKTSPPPPFGVGAQNLRVARFVEQGAEDHVIVAFANNTATYLVLGTLSLDKQSVSGWYTPVKMEFSGFSDLITLPNNHFVIAAEKAIYAGTATLKPGAMSISALGSVNYPEPVYRDVKLTALGVSTFVLSYDTGFINVNEYITFGAVVGSVIWDMANKIPNVTFATDPLTWHGTFPIHGLFALSDTTFVVAYSSAINDSSRQLACHHVRYTSGNRQLSNGTVAVFEGVVPEYYLAAVGLDSSSGVIVFVDRNKDYALRAVVIHRSTFQIDGLHFGDVMTIEDGVADNTYTKQFNESAVTFIDSAKVSANKAVVAWADYSNSGKLTTAILTLDQAANLHSSPLYVIGQELSLLQLTNYTVSVAGLSIDAYGQVGALVIDRKIATDAAGSGNVALIEVAPKAFGVAVQSAFTGQTAKIVVNGLVDLPRSFPNDLKPGYLYYGLTDGSIEAGPLAGTVDKSAPYVTLSDGTIVTVDSAVAVAVSKRQLYVLPSFN